MPTPKLIYQIYPSAIGSLADITKLIPQIAQQIGPDYIWISPIFQSPRVDGGYDVSDYCKIDPRFGNMKDFDRLVSVAKQHHIQILLDLVLNHTSDKHPWFKASEHGDRHYADYYVWLDRPLNWQSFFGGPAFDYNPIRGKYYLHLYDRSQPDLNFANPRVVREFREIIQFWQKRGVAGFRVDSANILAEHALKRGYLPRLTGFMQYYQSKRTVDVLEELLGKNQLFTIAEPIGGDLLSKRRFHELTAKAFDASFNIGTLDVADSFFSYKDHSFPINYRRWFKKLVNWTAEPKFSFTLESHDTPRASSRFHADPRVLAMLQFLLPNNYPCIYQGQELGTKNPSLSNNINDYPGVQSRLLYQRLRKKGQSKAEAMRQVKTISRDNARQPVDWGQYILQAKKPQSPLCIYHSLIQIWRYDPVIAKGELKVKRITKAGIFDFYRIYQGKKYFIHLDFSNQSSSYLENHHGEKLIKSR